MPLNKCDLLRVARGLSAMVALALLASPAAARSKRPVEDYAPSFSPEPGAASGNGAIFRPDAGYAALPRGSRAAMVGDVLTIVLVEAMDASKSSSTSTDRSSALSITPPSTGPLSFFSSTDVNLDSAQTFSGAGDAAQSNKLAGEMSVTVAAVYPTRSPIFSSARSSPACRCRLMPRGSRIWASFRACESIS